jgi:hypothetical protein
MKWTSWVAVGALVGIAAFVVYGSLQTGQVRCQVCVEFEGRRACRTVEAATEREAHAGARTNACALVTSGVTNMMACERAVPMSERCGTASGS